MVCLRLPTYAPQTGNILRLRVHLLVVRYRDTVCSTCTPTPHVKQVPSRWRQRADASIWWIEYDRSIQDHIPKTTSTYFTGDKSRQAWYPLPLNIAWKDKEAVQLWMCLIFQTPSTRSRRATCDIVMSLPINSDDKEEQGIEKESEASSQVYEITMLRLLIHLLA